MTSLNRKAQKQRLRANLSRQATRTRKEASPWLFSHHGILIQRPKTQGHMSESIKSYFNLSYRSLCGAFFFSFVCAWFNVLLDKRAFEKPRLSGGQEEKKKSSGLSVPLPQTHPATILAKPPARWNCVCVINCT